MSVYFNAVFVFPRLYVQSYNATSAPFTWGAPSPTALVGFIHALQRRLPRDLPIQVVSAGYVAHDIQTQTNGQFVRTFNLTRNPVGRDGKTPGIVEEGRAHLEASFILAVDVTDDSWLTDDHHELSASVHRVLAEMLTMRFAGGTLWAAAPGFRKAPRRPYVQILTRDSGDSIGFRRFRRSMLPGFALVARPDWLRDREALHVERGATHARLDAWMDAGRVRWSYRSGEEGATGEWVSSRQKGDGWIVPIPTGFVAISPLLAPGEVAHTRDSRVPFRFVETAYSVGEWVSPHRLQSFDELLWYPESDHEAGTYVCKNDFSLSANERSGD